MGNSCPNFSDLFHGHALHEHEVKMFHPPCLGAPLPPCKLSKEGSDVPNPIGSSAPQALPQRSKSLTKSHLIPQTSSLEAMTSCTDPEVRVWKLACQSDHRTAEASWCCRMTEPKKWPGRESHFSKVLLHQTDGACLCCASSLNDIAKCKQYRNKVYNQCLLF